MFAKEIFIWPKFMGDFLRLAKKMNSINPTALRKAKIVNNFGLSESNRVNDDKQRMSQNF